MTILSTIMNCWYSSNSIAKRLKSYYYLLTNLILHLFFGTSIHLYTFVILFYDKYVWKIYRFAIVAGDDGEPLIIIVITTFCCYCTRKKYVYLLTCFRRLDNTTSMHCTYGETSVFKPLPGETKIKWQRSTNGQARVSVIFLLLYPWPSTPLKQYHSVGKQFPTSQTKLTSSTSPQFYPHIQADHIYL